MSERRSLCNLTSYANVNGAEAVGRRGREERTRVERMAARMAERREETWRPMNKKCASAFTPFYLAAMVDRENAFRNDRQKKVVDKLLNEALVKRLIPYIYRSRVWSMDESLWPITLGEFRGLNDQLAVKFPEIHAGHQWQTIINYYEEIKWEQEEWKRLVELEREAMTAHRRVRNF